MSYDDHEDELEDDDDLDIRLPGVTVPTYLTQAILVTLCCCLPFGIVAITHASKVSTHLERREYEQAVHASQEAKKWCMIGVIVGIPLNLIVFWMRSTNHF